MKKFSAPVRKEGRNRNNVSRAFSSRRGTGAREIVTRERRKRTYLFRSGGSVLLLHHLTLVERKLRTLQDVAIRTTALTRARRDDRQETTRRELLVDRLGDFVLVVAVTKLHRHRLGSLCFDVFALNFLAILNLDANLLAVVLSVPRAERRRVDDDDGTLHERVRTHKLVVGRIVDDVQNTSLASAVLRAPRKVTGVQAQRAVLDVAPTASHLSHSNVGRELRVRRLTAELVFSLLSPRLLLATGGPALVQAVSRDTYASRSRAMSRRGQSSR